MFLPILVSFLLIILSSGCQPHPQLADYYSLEDIEEILATDEFLSKPLIGDMVIKKYPAEAFLFENHCWSFYRDMDYFLMFSARYNFLDLIIGEYPPQVVRTIENTGQRSMYFVYETDDNTRLFIFFFETDNFLFTRGYPIIMKKTLELNDFTELNIGDTISDVEGIDPIASLFRKGYDTLSDEMIKKIYVDGHETISTIHLLKDGIVRINYIRHRGDYIITHIYQSEDFKIPVLGGSLRYLIYPDDYF